jgi:hypothetical protein
MLTDNLRAIFDAILSCDYDTMNLAYVMVGGGVVDNYDPKLIRQYLVEKMHADRHFDIDGLESKLSQAVAHVQQTVLNFFSSDDAKAFYKAKVNELAKEFNLKLWVECEEARSYMNGGDMKIKMGEKGRYSYDCLVQFSYSFYGKAIFTGIKLIGVSGTMDKVGKESTVYKQICLQKKIVEYYMEKDFVQLFADANPDFSADHVKLYKFCKDLSDVVSRECYSIRKEIRRWHFDTAVEKGVFPIVFDSMDKKVGTITIKAVNMSKSGIKTVRAVIVCKKTKEKRVQVYTGDPSVKSYYRKYSDYKYITKYSKWRQDKPCSRKKFEDFYSEIEGYL